MRREREKVRVYEPYPGAKESDIYAETLKTGTLKTGTATSPVQMRAGAWKERERKEVGAQHVEDVSDEGHGNDAGFEDVNLAEEEVKKVEGAEKQQQEEEEEGGHQACYGAESREESDDDLLDHGFVIVKKYEWMVAEEVLSGVQTSQTPGHWKLARAAARKLGWY